MLPRLIRPLSVLWFLAAVVVFLPALYVFVENLRGPSEWDGRMVAADPVWGSIQFVPGLLAFVVASIGVLVDERRSWAWTWLAAVIFWALTWLAGFAFADFFYD